MIGHKKQWKLLSNMALIGELPHALLFSGQEQLGKKTMAIELAKLLLGADVEKNCHPDFIFQSGTQIKDIRDLIWKLSLKPYSAGMKIALIDNAHLLNIESQSCFLKTLEEPKGKVLIIMVTSYPEMMLPTIMSRISQIKFFPVPAEEIKSHFNENMSSLSMGRPGRAMELSLNSDKIKEYETIISDLKKIVSSDLGERFKYAKKVLADDDSSLKLKEILEDWLNYFRTMLLDKISGKGSYSVLKIKNIINKIQAIYYLVSTTNVNQKLALEIVMMEL
jgi:DNA polymerase-3 subunit delta'